MLFSYYIKLLVKIEATNLLTVKLILFRISDSRIMNVIIDA